MTRLPVSLLMVLAVLASVVQTTVTINLPDSTFQEKEIVSTIPKFQMAQDFFSQDNEISDSKEVEEDFEIRTSGFSGVMKAKDNEVTNIDKRSIADEDLPNVPDDQVDSLRHHGYTKMGDGRSWYKYHTRGTSWEFAKATCEREGAHLAVINSEEEAQLLADEFSWYSIRATYDNQIWIGVSDIAEEGHFVTVLGQNLTDAGYNIWMAGQPDDWKVDDPNGEDCVTIRSDKLFNDLHCWATMAYACEAGDTNPKIIPGETTEDPTYEYYN